MFDELSDITLIETPLMDSAGFLELLLRFCFNLLVVSCIIHLFYYPKSKRRDYYFTFTLISISIFLMIFLLGSVKLKIGFALGLFAIFGIIRYRTESMPVREMTYLFVHCHFGNQCSCRRNQLCRTGMYQLAFHCQYMALRKQSLAETYLL